jgi:hypothetical protein
MAGRKREFVMMNEAEFWRISQGICGGSVMSERIKVFTFLSGHGETLLEPRQEDTINQWLASVKGNIVQVSQSESARQGVGHHVTVCVWYVPEQ